MTILSAQARTEAARLRLRKSRRLATGLLFWLVVLFVAAAMNVRQYPALGYVKAFAEAAMVGALADWFAVTALFRRPLGLPIPHTAILPRNQHRIADELGALLKTILQGRFSDVLRVYQAAPSEKLLAWLAAPANRARWLPWLASRSCRRF